MADGLREAYGPVLGTLRLLLDEVRLLVDDGVFGLVEEGQEALPMTISLVDGTGTRSTLESTSAHDKRDGRSMQP